MRFFNDIIKGSKWYQKQYGDAQRILHAPFSLDVMNLGSNPAKYGIDYSDCGFRGFNFAVGPQTIEFDFKMLRRYYCHLSYLGPRILLLVFCPFGTCKSEYTKNDGEVYKNIRYYQLLNHNEIPNFDKNLYNSRIINPLKYAVRSWKSVLVSFKMKDLLEQSNNSLTDEQMCHSAASYINNWKREFYLSDLSPANLSGYVKEALRSNRVLLDNIKAFCVQHDIKPFIVLPPLSNELNELIPDDFREYCTYSVLRREDISLLDYSKDQRFCQKEFFIDALKLNKKGRRIFTNQLMIDIQNVLNKIDNN